MISVLDSFEGKQIPDNVARVQKMMVQMRSIAIHSPLTKLMMKMPAVFKVPLQKDYMGFRISINCLRITYERI